MEVIIFIQPKLLKRAKKAVKVEILGCELSDKESNLSIHLGQVISRGDRMEFTIQNLWNWA